MYRWSANTPEYGSRSFPAHRPALRRIPLLVFYDSVRANCSAKISVMENIIVNRQEQQRGLMIAAVDRGTLSVREGAAVLGVSARHVRTAYRQWGVAALAHGNRGKAPTNAAEATACLPAFLADFNTRCTVPAAEEGACYRAMEAETDLDTLFCFKYQRTVGMDNTVRFGGVRLQLLPGACRRSWARAIVEV